MEQGELIEEAVERAGIDPSTLNHRHINSIKRSLMLTFTEIEREGASVEFRLDEDTQSVSSGAAAFALPADAVDIVDAILVMSDGTELPLKRFSREDYLSLSNRTETGTPSSYWVSKSLPAEIQRLPGSPVATNQMLLVLWPAMGLTGASIRTTRLRQIADPGALGDDVDVRRNWLETLCRGLAAKVAEKFNKAEEPRLTAKYLDDIVQQKQNQDRHPVTIGFRAHGWGRGRRH